MSPDSKSIGPEASNRAPRATPSAKPMGGPNSAVAAHIILDSDAFVLAVDRAGAISATVSCLVPAPPK